MSSAEKIAMLTRQRIVDAEKLSASIKNNGLERAVVLMTIEERGYARRLIRDGLQLVVDEAKKANQEFARSEAFLNAG